MNVSAAPSTTIAMAAASQQLQGIMETQMAILRELAESQQQIAAMLAESGLGQAIDVRV